MEAHGGQRRVRVAVDGVGFGQERGVLTYAVPAGWTAPLDPGMLVWVPIQKRIELGMVHGDEPDEPEFEIRALHAPVEPVIRLPEIHFETARWLARETVSSLYSTAALFLPPGIQLRRVEMLSLVDGAFPLDTLTRMQAQVVELLRNNGRMSLEALRSATGQSLQSVIAKLVEQGVVNREIEVDQHIPQEQTVQVIRLVSDDPALTNRSPKQAEVQQVLAGRRRLMRDGDPAFTTVEALRDRVELGGGLLRAMEKKGIVELADVPRSKAPLPRPVPPPVLTPKQAAVWTRIERSLVERDPTPTLLFGVTGSGKTEMYLRACAWSLRFGRGAIILMPEIALATQIVRRFIERFPGKVAILHSQMKDSERYATWKAIQRGDLPIVIGPRSALFAPVVDPGVIVLDEEHESTYKQDVEPRYHARAVAEHLARAYGAPLLLGSATPSIESWVKTESGEWRRLELAERVAPNQVGEALELPPVEIVDLRQELVDGNMSLISRRLHESVEQAIRRGEQSILLLNRRGQSTVVLCRACGHRLQCPHCEIPLVFHRDDSLLICHRCDFREPPPRSCPDCHGKLDFFGSGTQRVEEEVQSHFPGATVLRWDQDSVRKQGGYAAMLGRVESGEVDIVIGTQMVAKGFDLPKVTVVGVVQADSMLHLPDFRSAERTFQLVTQVAGRAGRRAPGSRVIVQTYTPNHYAIEAAADHDFPTFYRKEIEFRQHYVYPPQTRLIRCSYRHEKERVAAIEADMQARRVAKLARQEGVEIDIMGPTPAFAAKIRGQYQWQIVVRGHDLDPLLDAFPAGPGWAIDVDPQSML